MKKLQKIDFTQCDSLSKEQMNTIRGGEEKTHCCVCNYNTEPESNPDTGYTIVWDDGTTSTGVLEDPALP
jgi:natural product precursor